MRFKHVCLESLGYTLPEEEVTSEELEDRLGPVYERLRLPEGRLELMTGIRARRFWKSGTLPSEKSVASADRALEAAGINRSQIGALIHASVCRDYLEPATASVVHSKLALPNECLIYDVSNACLGFLNGMIQIASQIELGHIRAGVVVSSEGSRELVETTIERLNIDESFTRESIKLAVASLTIGSASAAAVLCHRDLSDSGSRLLGGEFYADTSGVDLCHSGRDEAVAENMQPFMLTDSEALMHQGIAVGKKAFGRFLEKLDWSRDDIAHSVCHQVGSMHRRMMLKELGLNPETDFTTLEFLGNTGSAALPVTAAIAAEKGVLGRDDNVAFLGIGSGINCVMLGLNWQATRVLGA